MPYQHLTESQRNVIFHLNMFGLSKAEIGHRLGRHPPQSYSFSASAAMSSHEGLSQRMQRQLHPAFGRLADGLHQRWVWMNGMRQLLHRKSIAHGKREFLDKVGGVWSNDQAAQNASAVGVGNYLDHPLGLTEDMSKSYGLQTES